MKMRGSLSKVCTILNKIYSLCFAHKLQILSPRFSIRIIEMTLFEPTYQVWTGQLYYTSRHIVHTIRPSSTVRIVISIFSLPIQ